MRSVSPPFGMVMPNRSYSAGAYRFGYNTQEKDDEICGAGNTNTAMFWEYSTRLGRRWNIDPINKPHESVYSTFSNNPIYLTDISGSDTTVYMNTSNLEKFANKKGIKGDAYKELKTSLISNMNEIYKANGINVNIVQTNQNFESLKGKLDESDQYIDFVFDLRNKNNDQARGGTYDNDICNTFHSSINLGNNKTADELTNRVTTQVANDAVHETCHGYMDRLAVFAGFSIYDKGFDAGGHFSNGRVNLLSMGDARTNTSITEFTAQYHRKLDLTDSRNLLNVYHAKAINIWMNYDKTIHNMGLDTRSQTQINFHK